MDPFARAGPSSKPARAIATFIVYQGRTLKASIDDNVPVTEIVAQLCQSVNEPAAFYCLRDFETDEIVSDANLLSKLEKGSRLKLVSSPVIEAADMVEKLSTRDDKTVKLATFELKRFIQEPVFIEEFVSRGGLIELVACIESVHGNALSYALASLQQLMESSSRGWESLDTPFIAKVGRAPGPPRRSECLAGRRHLLDPVPRQRRPPRYRHPLQARPVLSGRSPRRRAASLLRLLLRLLRPLAPDQGRARLLPDARRPPASGRPPSHHRGHPTPRGLDAVGPANLLL
jgi:hypothetical protein